MLELNSSDEVSILQVENAPGYDGHCLRAFAYFGEHMPDIQNCPATATPYKVVVGDDAFYFHSEEKVEYLGQEYLGSELFKLLNK